MLNNAELLKNAGYINGEWTGSESDKRFEVTNAFSKEVICTLPDMGAKETNDAIEAANNSWSNWRSRTAKERAVILKKWFDLITNNQEDLAILMTAEQGNHLQKQKAK